MPSLSWEYRPYLQVLVLEVLFGGELLVEPIFEQLEKINDRAALSTLSWE
jgi:hypothetical protein